MLSRVEHIKSFMTSGPGPQSLLYDVSLYAEVKESITCLTSLLTNSSKVTSLKTSLLPTCKTEQLTEQGNNP